MNLITLINLATARNTLQQRYFLAMARSAIGTRSVTGRAAAAAELAKASRATTRVNSKHTKITDGVGAEAGRLQSIVAEDDESELSSVPSDLSDEEGAVHNGPTTSRHFVSLTGAGILPTTLGKRQRPTATDAGAGAGVSGSVERELRKRGKAKISNARDLISSFSSSTNARGLPLVRKGPVSCPIGAASPSRRAARQILKPELQVEPVREEVEGLSINAEDNEEEIVGGKGRGRSKKLSRGSSNKRTKPTQPNPQPPPPHWEEMYSLVRSMRSRIPAPVDTMGCERLAQPVGGPITPAISRFQTLVSLLLSSQTKDTVTATAVRKMQTLLPGGLTIPSILATDPQRLDSLITPVGFHNRKTQYLLQTAKICQEKYNSDIPRSIEDLCSLPGVGPKMAHLCMSAAWNETQGIGVDVHVHRITNMWGWTGRKGTETPEQTRLALESWLPRDRWREINHLLVGFGQSVCLSRAPKCGECSLAERGLCRAARVPPAEGRENVREEDKMEIKEENELEDIRVKVDGEGEVGRELKRELSIPANVKWEAGGSWPGRVKREVKLEGQETRGGEVSIKREIKSEEAVVSAAVKTEAMDGDRVKEEWVEGVKEYIPDIEDLWDSFL